MARRGRRPPLVLAVPSLAAALIAVAPIAYLVDRAVSGGWAEVADELFRVRTAELVARSVWLTFVVGAASVVIGVSAALLVVRTDVPGRRALGALLAVPLAIPSYVAAYTWVSWQRDLDGFTGSALVLTLVSYPYVFLPAAAALRRLDSAQEEVARSLGAGRWTVLRTVTLRQIRPAVAAGGLLVALYVLSEFGVVGTMRYEVFTWTIYVAYRGGFDPTRAAILACLLVVVALVLVAVEARVRGRPSFARLGSGAPRPQPTLPLGAWRWPALAGAAVVVAAGVGVPFVSLGVWFRRSVAAAVDWERLGSAVVDTAWFSLMGAAITVALAVPVGILAARHRGWAASLVERSVFVAHALPGIVVALALVAIGVTLLRPLYQTAPLVGLAYAVLLLPLGVGAVRASVEQAPARLDEVGRSLGSSPWDLLRRVTLPLAAPGIAAGTALVLLTALKELPATLLLHPTGSETLAMGLWSNTTVGRFAAAAPYGVALMLLAAAPTWALTRRRP